MNGVFFYYVFIGTFEGLFADLQWSIANGKGTRILRGVSRSSVKLGRPAVLVS